MILGRKKEEILVWLFFGTSLFLNFYNLEQLPPAVHNDEAEHGLEALRILQGESKIVGLSSFYNMPLSSFLHQSLTIFLFGPSVFGVRAASAFVGSLSLLFFFYLIKLLFNGKIALLATALLSFSHFWIAFSHLGINYNLSVFFMIITFIFLIRTIKGGRLIDGFFLGVFCASSLYLYFSSRVVPLILAVTLTLCFLKFSLRPRIGVILLALIGFLVAAFPMFLVFAKNPKSFNSRTNNVFLFSGEMKPWLLDVYKTDSKMRILTSQVKRSLNLSSRNCESSGQYGYCGRILDIPTLVLVLLGMSLSFWKMARWENFFLLFWFWMIIIFGSFLTVPPLFMPRILGALPVAYIFFSRGLYFLRDFLLKRLRSKDMKQRLLLDMALMMMVIFVVVHNLKIYFVKYPRAVWGDTHKYTATRIGRMMGDYKDYQFVFITTPFLYPDFSTLAYLALGTKRTGIEELTSYFFDPKAHRVIYIFYPQYRQKLIEARKIYPAAELTEVKVFPESQPSAYLLKVD